MLKRKIAIAFSVIVFISKLSAQTSYVYKNVQIRGGGYVTGLIFNSTRQNMLYARTDVGGAYKWNSSTGTWTPLTDHLGAADQNYTGVLSIATDPVDTNRVYLATGLYTPSWAGNAAILRSSDRGSTWTKTNLSIKLGGNEDGRGAGELLQVDPNLNSILFLGTSADGLWKSIDYGATWSQVSSFPASTVKVAFVVFKKNSGSSGSATPEIYVGLMQTGTNLYKSIDGGATWSAVAGASSTLMPYHAALSSTNILYITYTNAQGPNGVSSGAVWKYNIGTSAWTQIDGTIPSYTQGGYAGISVDASSPNTVVVSTVDRWWPQDEVYITTNGGTSWTKKFTTGTRVETSAPWAAGSTPHWTTDIEIDPFNSNNVWFVTGYGVYATNNLSNAAPTWTFTNTGLEEIVALEIVSPPSGAPLLSAVGDQDGFRHINLDVSPAAGKFTSYGTNSSIDFAQNNPNYIVRTHYSSSGNMGCYSTDQGITWTSFGSYPASGSGGVIAVSPDASKLVWEPGSSASVSYSTNNGSTWIASTGINAGVAPEADRVNSNKFYAYDAANGNVLISTNGGVSFSNAATGFGAVPSWNLWTSGIRAVFGIEGDVWLHNPDGLFHSTNSASTFTQIANVGTTYQIAFGKSKTTGGYPAVYIVGYVSGVYGFFRSDNAGSTWTRINDDAHQYGGVNALAADPNIYGRIYLGTGGRGIIYGDAITALPLDMVFFKGTSVTKNEKKFAHLQWQTANEINTSYFIIEKSTDCMQWKQAGKINAHPNNGNYDFDDDITGASAKIFYRLQIVDADGEKTFSRIVVIDNKDVSASFVSAYPNPVTDGIFSLNFYSNDNDKVWIKVFDVSGNEVYSSDKLNIPAGYTTMKIAALQNKPAGIYVVCFYSENGAKKTSVNILKQ
jgi:hypothetical protein